MSILQIIILSVIQGICELLPISSSAHVCVAAKLMGIDPSSPEMTFLLIMLHTGTMFAMIAYFWHSWQEDYFSSAEAFRDTVRQLFTATVATGIVGVPLILIIEKVFMRGLPKAEVELLFGNLHLIAAALGSVGLLILFAGRGPEESKLTLESDNVLNLAQSAWIGAVQGVCLPFRGFSRSGATISTGLLLGVSRMTAEKFSFALAVVLTPPVVYREVSRLVKAHAASPASASLSAMAVPGLIGMVCSFAAGLLALRWLSRWLEGGRWHWFGVYCLAAAVFVWFGVKG